MVFFVQDVVDLVVEIVLTIFGEAIRIRIEHTIFISRQQLLPDIRRVLRDEMVVHVQHILRVELAIQVQLQVAHRNEETPQHDREKDPHQQKARDVVDMENYAHRDAQPTKYPNYAVVEHLLVPAVESEIPRHVPGLLILVITVDENICERPQQKVIDQSISQEKDKI